jgi:hypothetical protein
VGPLAEIKCLRFISRLPRVAGRERLEPILVYREFRFGNAQQDVADVDVEKLCITLRSERSPDEAQRNPGFCKTDFTFASRPLIGNIIIKKKS